MIQLSISQAYIDGGSDRYSSKYQNRNTLSLVVGGICLWGIMNKSNLINSVLIINYRHIILQKILAKKHHNYTMLFENSNIQFVIIQTAAQDESNNVIQL